MNKPKKIKPVKRSITIGKKNKNSKVQLERDFQALIDNGIIVITGYNEDNEPLYGIPSEK